MSILTIQDEIRREAKPSDTKLWLTVDPWRSSKYLVFDWLGIALSLIILSKVQTWWMFVLVTIWIGLRQYALFILGHDAMHGSLYPDHKVNDRVSRWLIHGPLFMGFEDGKRNHLEHHKLMGSTADPDRYLHILSNKSSTFDFMRFCCGLATFGRTVMKVTPFGNVKRPKSESMTFHQLVETLCSYARERIPVFLGQFVILSSFWCLGLPMWTYLFVWVAPIYLFVYMPSEVRAFAEHAVLSFQDDLVDEQRLVTYRPSVLEAAYFSPHNMNYHAEHHLWPRIPHYNLPQVHDAVKHRPEITVRRSYFEFLSQVFSFLRSRHKQLTIRLNQDRT